MSMRLTPAKPHPSTFSHLGEKSKGAPSAPGLHDTLRAGVGPSNQGPNVLDSSHPLEARLKQWEAAQESLRMGVLRRTYGMAEPIRRGMELKVVRDGEWRPSALGGNIPSVHEDILRGRDTTVTWEDVFTGEETRPIMGLHDEMERRLKI